jgi:hypothetical protein
MAGKEILIENQDSSSQDLPHLAFLGHLPFAPVGLFSPSQSCSQPRWAAAVDSITFGGQGVHSLAPSRPFLYSFLPPPGLSQDLGASARISLSLCFSSTHEGSQPCLHIAWGLTP